MGEQALSIGADTFQFFTRNPRGGSVKPFDRQDADALNAALSEYTGQKMRGKEHSKLREKLRAPIERVVTHKKQREQSR